MRRDNCLKGSAKYACDPAMKVVVSVTFPDGKTEQARFEPLKAGGMSRWERTRNLTKA